MKDNIMDALVIAARPEAYGKKNKAFTDRVMEGVAAGEILSHAIRKTSVNKKETLFMKLRHLPKLAIVAIALGALLFVAGTTYAIVQTVSTLSPVKVNQAGTNEFGREQLKVEFDSCDAQKEEGTTYELKRGSNLSSDDGAKVLRAKCDMDVATAWMQNDPKTKETMGDFLRAFARLTPGMNTADTVKEIQGNKLTLEKRGEKTLLEDVRVVEGNNIVSLDSIKPGDTVIYFVPATFEAMGNAQDAKEANGVVIFKLPLEARYYSLEYQSYVHVRAACDGNPERVCLQSNGINQTNLIVTNGGTGPSMNDSRTSKRVQGRVVSYDAASMKLDVGEGVIYTVQTPRNIIDEYNRTKVYGLASYDTIYANTNPEDLKIKQGDSLDIYYLEAEGASASTLAWNQVGTIGLMVERTVNDLSVLQKY